jgi:hypothetical protein
MPGDAPGRMRQRCAHLFGSLWESPVNINCISCGHKFDVGKAYDDYEGLVRCSTCRTLLDVKIQDGGVRSVRFGMTPAAAAKLTLANEQQDAVGRSAGDSTAQDRRAA